VVRGISPLSQRRSHPTVLDVSAGDHDTILVSAGRRGLQIELRPGDLTSITSATVAPIARRR
jgi:Cys-tRNA(Pro)/Cys-tRNA(Cys) deacylase